MAAPILLKASAATFDGSTLVHVTGAEITSQGSEQTARGDGATAAQLAWVENVHMRVTVNALEGDVAGDCIMPRAGALAITSIAQAAGAGDSGDGQVYSFPEATFLGQSRGLPLDGTPTVNYNFICVAASGDPADIFSIS